MTDTSTRKTEKITFSNGDIYKGNIGSKTLIFGKISYGKEPHGKGKYFYKNGHIYEGNFRNGLKYGKGRFTVVNKETKKPLYTQVYNEGGIMENVEYLFEDEDNHYKMTINYYEINRALNRGEINEIGDLRRYITVFDEQGNEIKNYNIVQSIRQCAKHQMQTRLKGRNGELDDANRMTGGYTGLENLVILAEVIDSIKALKRTRFGIKQNNPNWPKNIYRNRESLLNSMELTLYNPPRNNRLTPVTTLLKNNVKYICRNTTTTANNHAVAITIDLQKIVNNEKDFIFCYDSSRAISIAPDMVGNLGNLQPNCQFYNHNQQRFGSCWFNAAIAAIVMAKHPEIFNGIIKNEIIPIERKRPSFFTKFLKKIGIIKVKLPTEFNYLETLQILKLQEVAKDLEIERFGKDNKRMIHQIVNEPTRGAIKIWANNYFREHENLNCLENRLNTYESLLVIGYNEGLGVNELGPKARQILSERARSINEERILVNEDEIMRPKKGGIFNKILAGLRRTFRIFRKSSIIRNEESNKKLIETNKELTNAFRKATERNRILLDKENKQLNLLNRDIEIRTPLERTK